MLLIRSLLLVLLLVSGQGFAQSPPPLVPAPPPTEQGEPPAPQGESIPYAYEPELAPDSSGSAGRVMFELLGGAVGGAGGLLTGGLLAGLFAIAAGDCADAETACSITALVLLVPSLAVGPALGVYAFGKVLGGQGSFLGALYGVAAGAGMALLAGVVTNSGPVLVVGLLSAPIIGAVVGYEIAHSRALERGPRPRSKPRDDSKGEYGDEYASYGGFQWSPVVGTTVHGGLFGGLSGRF